MRFKKWDRVVFARDITSSQLLIKLLGVKGIVSSIDFEGNEVRVDIDGRPDRWWFHEEELDFESVSKELI